MANPWAKAAAKSTNFGSVAGRVFGPFYRDKNNQKINIKYPVLK